MVVSAVPGARHDAGAIPRVYTGHTRRFPDPGEQGHRGSYPREGKNIYQH